MRNRNFKNCLKMPKDKFATGREDLTLTSVYLTSVIALYFVTERSKVTLSCKIRFVKTLNRSHNRGRRPQARGPRKTIEKDKCAIFSKNCATLNVIDSRGYTQICVGLSDSLHARLKPQLKHSTHAIDKSFN